MALLYDRLETPTDIEYRFRFLPLLYIALGFATALSVEARGQRTNEFLGAWGLLLLAWMVGVWKPMSEIQRAMTHGSVEMTGNKFSFRNPLRVVLHKYASIGGGVPGSVSLHATAGF